MSTSILLRRFHHLAALDWPQVWLVAMIAASSLATTAQADQTPADGGQPKINYDEHVKPIFRQHCVSCHNQNEAKGGLALDTMAGLMQGGGSGDVVYDGDSEGSRLWQLIAHEDTPEMPPGADKIPQEQIDTVAAWIMGGLLENAGSKARKRKTNTVAFTASSSGRPEGPPPMPTTLPQATPLVTERAAAITAIAASPWAPLVAVAGQRQIAMYHSDSGELLGILPFPEGTAQSLRFSRNGSYLIAGGGEHSAMGLAVIFDIKTGERIAEVGDEYDVVFDADANDDLSKVALGGPQRMVRIYSTDSGDLLFDLKKHTDWIYAVAFSPDGVLIASGDRAAGLVVWEADTGRQYLDLTDHKGAINSIAWRDDSNVFASASDDGTVKMWDIIGGKAIKSINAHNGGATSVAFDHEGRLVTAGKDRLVKLWDANGNPIREFAPMSELALAVAITHDGSRIVAGDWNGMVRVVPSDNPESMQTLSANPPPASARLPAEQEKLVALESEFQKSLTRQNELASQLAAAEAALAQATEQRDQKAAESAQAKAQAEALTAAADAIDTQLPQLTASNRDQHDLLIAARVADLSSEQAQLLLAQREADLAEQLAKSAQLRRELLAKRAEAATQAARATELQGQAESMAPAIAAASEARDQAQQAVDAHAAEHDQLVEARQALQQRIALLEDAIG